MKNMLPINMTIKFHRKTVYAFMLTWFMLAVGCTPPEESTWEDVNEEGTFLVYRRQSLIGEESYSITSTKEGVVVKSLQGENERGRITGVQAEMQLDIDLNPIYYVNQRIANDDTTNIFKFELAENKASIYEKHFDEVKMGAPTTCFPLHSNIPAAMEMMLYHYYFKHGKTAIPTLPRGEVSITHTAVDTAMIQGKEIALHRYVVEGINWGGRTIWLDQDNNLIAVVKANTQIRELIRKGYEEALPVFVKGNVIEQMDALAKYTADHKLERPDITALVGGDVVDGISDTTRKDMTIIIENGRIKTIGTRKGVEIPDNAMTIDVTGKTLIPGLWDMHAHSNQVQWAPAYLAGGVTTIRDNGNEVDFATAFRDAIDLEGMLGPDILLAGMTDGAGDKGNGAIRATSVEQARMVVDMYYDNGYKQIKIYNSIAPDILKVLADEAHKKGMTVTGHVPTAVQNIRKAVELGMDQVSHDRSVLSLFFPELTARELGNLDIDENKITAEQVKEAITYLMDNEIGFDPTINLSVIRGLSTEESLDNIEPGAERIAYELWEGKRFRKGIPEERAAIAKARYTRIMEIVGKFYQAGIPIVAGTDNAVPVFSLYQELETYHKLAGLKPLETIRTATLIPAQQMGLEAETGTLEVGKEADIAILERNPLEKISHLRTVSAVMSNGHYYESKALWQAADFKANN